MKKTSFKNALAFAALVAIIVLGLYLVGSGILIMVDAFTKIIGP
jgi:hypothetical protein